MYEGPPCCKPKAKVSVRAERGLTTVKLRAKFIKVPNNPPFNCCEYPDMLNSLAALSIGGCIGGNEDEDAESDDGTDDGTGGVMSVYSCQ